MRWLTERYGASGSGGSPMDIGIGDDMALLAGADPILITCDMLLDGCHFDSTAHTLEQIGTKAASCSLSDCAAMAVQPRAAVASVAIPPAIGTEGAKVLSKAIADRCEAYGARLVGGDTTGWRGPLVVDIAMLGSPYPGIAPVRRSGAMPGDGVFVTGPLGGSLLGRHLTFTPRVREARAIAEAFGDRLHAMLDISDGLAIDLDRMTEASGVGAVLDEPNVLACAHADARRAAATDGRSLLDHVLGDGEDFELLLAADVDDVTAVRFNLTRVGIVESTTGLRLRETGGAIRPLEPIGYDHLR